MMAKPIEELLHKLHEAGCRITPARRAVVSVVVRSAQSLQPMEIISRARKLHPSVNLATVYRTLDVLPANAPPGCGLAPPPRSSSLANTPICTPISSANAAERCWNATLAHWPRRLNKLCKHWALRRKLR